MSDFSFSPLMPRCWSGRYARIPGDTTAFHVRMFSGHWRPVVEWVTGDETAQCPMEDIESAATLASAVNAGKRFLGGSPGGSFLVNEYGQVLVPSPFGIGEVVLVGECSGRMAFHDSSKSIGLFDLTSDQGLTLGDAWNLPYLGIPYNLSRSSEIYFWHRGRVGSWKATPPSRDDSLVDALRSIRPWGPIRFVVTPGGLVLTKVPVGGWRNERWETRFVGRVNYKKWFPKEV